MKIALTFPAVPALKELNTFYLAQTHFELKKPFGLHGLYKNISVLEGLNVSKPIRTVGQL